MRKLLPLLLIPFLLGAAPKASKIRPDTANFDNNLSASENTSQKVFDVVDDFANGIVVDPGSDTDVDILTVGVTGAPAFKWDESSDIFRINKGVSFDDNDNGDVSHTVAGTTLESNIELHSEGDNDLGGLAIHRHTDTNNFGGHAIFLRSRGTHDSPTIIAVDDDVMRIGAAGYDGTDYDMLGEIRFASDGTPSNGTDMPGRLEFLTVADGSASPVERMRIDNQGNVGIGDTDPLEKLHVEGNFLVEGTTPYIKIENGTPAEAWTLTLDGDHFRVNVDTPTKDTHFHTNSPIHLASGVDDILADYGATAFTYGALIDDSITTIPNNGFNTSFISTIYQGHTADLTAFVSVFPMVYGDTTYDIQGLQFGSQFLFYSDMEYSTTSAAATSIGGFILFSDSSTIHNNDGPAATAVTQYKSFSAQPEFRATGAGKTLNQSEFVGLYVAGTVRTLSSGTTTLAGAYGMRYIQPTLTGANTSVTSQYGIEIQDLNNATTNVGILLYGADEGAIWFDHDGARGGGIYGEGQDSAEYWDGSDHIIDPDYASEGTGTVLIGTTGDDDLLLNDIEVDGTLNVDGTVDIDATSEMQIDGALTDFGTGTYTVANGDKDVGIAGDLEVEGQTHGDYYSSAGNAGVTDNTSWWLCTANDCSTTCQATFEDGLLISCP